MLRTKQIHTYTYYKFMQHHYINNTPSREINHRFHFINFKYTSSFFLNFTFCILDTNYQGTLRSYDPINQMYVNCFLTKTFNEDESSPRIVPHEFLQPVEIPIQDFIHKNKYTHKLYNLIQHTPYDFSPSTEEQKIIKELELRIFPHGFFPDE